jgi:MFS family permease
VLGGWLIEHASWRWVFFINVPIAAAAVGILMGPGRAAVKGDAEAKAANAKATSKAKAAGGGARSTFVLARSTRASVDWFGAVVATLGLGGVVYGFIESVNLGWRNPQVFVSLAAGGGCLIAFGFLEAKVSAPMVPLALFKSRSFSGANLLTMLLYGAMGIFFFLFPMNLIQVQGYSATAAGGALLPLILLLFLLSRWSGGLVARYRPRIPLTVGPVIAALGFAGFAAPSIGGSYWKMFFPAVMVLGLGMAVTVAPLTTVVMNSVNPDRVGAASGINNAVSRVASVVAIAALGIVMVQSFGHRLEHDLAHSVGSGVMEELHAGETKLAGLRAPEGVDAEARRTIRESVDRAFVFGFRIVMFICAGLALAGAGVAWGMIAEERAGTLA